MPLSNVSSERLCRVSLAAPEFVGALPRVLEDNYSARQKLRDSVGLGQITKENLTGVEDDEEETLCRAALDHIARSFDHVAMVSELLHEALEALEPTHRTTKQRRTAWLHAALGDAFLNVEPVSLDVEAARHLDAALEQYEDDKDGKKAWAWPRAFLLGHLGYCALRLGDVPLCASVFLKLAHADVRFFLSNPAVAVAAQRDAFALLTHGILDNDEHTVLLRGFEPPGELKFLRKDSSEIMPAKSTLGLIEWSAWFGMAETHAPAPGDDTYLDSVIEIRLRASSPEPLHFEYIELAFRPKDIFRETLIVTANDIFQANTNQSAGCGLIPGRIYSWSCATRLQVLRCGSATADTLTILLTGRPSPVTSAIPIRIPVVATRGLFEGAVQRYERFASLQIKHAIAGVKLALDGPSFMIAAKPSFMMVTLQAIRDVLNQVLVVDLSSTSTYAHFDLAFQAEHIDASRTLHGNTSSGGQRWRFMFSVGDIIAHSSARKIGFWVTCHHECRIVCAASIQDIMTAESPIDLASNDDHGREAAPIECNALIKLVVFSPFLASFEVLKSPTHRDAILQLEAKDYRWICEYSAVLECLNGRRAKLCCTFESPLLVPIAIRAVFYKCATNAKLKPLLPHLYNGTIITTLAQYETFTVQFTTSQLSDDTMATSLKIGCLVVLWSAVFEGSLDVQVVETHFECPSVLVVEPVLSCKFDIPSRTYLGNSFTSTWCIDNKVLYPQSLKLQKTENSSSLVCGGVGRYSVQLLSQETFPVDIAHFPLYIGKNKLPDLCLRVQFDSTSLQHQTGIFVCP